MQDYSADATVVQDEHSDYSADKGSCNFNRVVIYSADPRVMRF